ncbi:MAG: hypothetical protein NTW49_00860 [Bacteroidia bacterium]|nr:hypothetical protein [Bacteroidia bacterium]
MDTIRYLMNTAGNLISGINGRYNPSKHHGWSIRLKGFDYSSEEMYFITICIKDHHCLFGKITGGLLIST